MCVLSLPVAIDVVIEEDNRAINIISSSGASLMCTPIVSCDKTYNITWERMLFNGSNLPPMDENGTTLVVGSREYGKYMCTVNSSDTSAILTYTLYGKLYKKSSHIWYHMICVIDLQNTLIDCTQVLHFIAIIFPHLM